MKENSIYYFAGPQMLAKVYENDGEYVTLSGLCRFVDDTCTTFRRQRIAIKDAMRHTPIEVNRHTPEAYPFLREYDMILGIKAWGTRVSGKRRYFMATSRDLPEATHLPPLHDEHDVCWSGPRWLLSASPGFSRSDMENKRT